MSGRLPLNRYTPGPATDGPPERDEQASVPTPPLPTPETPSGRGEGASADDTIPLPVVAAWAAAVAWMLVLYRPWQSAPFSILDFSEFLPLLKTHASFGERLRALVSYYASQGRFNPLPYAALALKWTVFGDDPVAWQWVRACQMIGIFAAAVAFLRELRFGWRATACGALLFVTAAPVAAAWTRMTMGEPLAVCFLFVAAFLALRYQRTERWRGVAAGIAASLLCALLTKEMLALAVPFVLLVAWLYRGDGEWAAFPERSRRNVVLLGAVAAAAVAAAVPVLYVVAHARVGSFGANYGASAISAGAALGVLQRFALPFGGGLANVFGNLLYVAVVVAGFVVARGGADRSRFRPAAWLAAASLPVLGAALYVPWPRLEAFYALPSLLGSALLLALAVEALARRGRTPALVATAACAVIALSSSELADFKARSELSRRRADGEVARLLAYVPPNYPTVLALRPEDIKRGRAEQWFMQGPTLSRYTAAVTGRRAPLMVEMTCAEAGALLRVSRPVIVSYGGACAYPGPPTIGLRVAFDYWQGVRRQHAVLGADVVWPLPLPGASPSR